MIAAAIAERQVTPLQFTMAKIMDPMIRAQLNKIVVAADPEIEKVFPALQRVMVRIQTIDGREFTTQLDYPKGDPRNPLTDKEVEEKFEALAGPVMSREARRRAMDAIWSLEKQASVTELMRLFSADRACRGRSLRWDRRLSRKSRRPTWPRDRAVRCALATSSPSGRIT